MDANAKLFLIRLKSKSLVDSYLQYQPFAAFVKKWDCWLLGKLTTLENEPIADALINAGDLIIIAISQIIFDIFSDVGAIIHSPVDERYVFGQYRLQYVPSDSEARMLFIVKLIEDGDSGD